MELLVAGFVPPVVVEPAAPEVAVTIAVPDSLPAENVAVAMLLVVSASEGVTVPSVVVKSTVVPFWTGVPALSTTKADSCTVSFRARTRFGALSVMDEPVGANRGILSHDAATNT